ncbi:type II toxin-antitoxin system RelE/ParE family toxin [Patescibacteria group bacterium]|nr:type II toxin-antitoxin system RelE/ParE family toxin [Patescibacteria group bacterium]MBU4512364.1 type II toxin-antitoxin system RelE/ParE family toxin [Patescibacteria group bacterium]MCG2692790.1 type II toxin-antitoxin system RelE/ParE family toxin [Candidatus Parcubacteria bacterium]
MIGYNFAKKVDKRLSKLPVDIQKRIVNKIEDYCTREEPLRFTKPLGGGFYRFRIGDFRIIFKWKGLSILITKIDHRGKKDLYRRFLSLLSL